jgi:DHA1 family tetracycline resistance protein-like MFS transporter
MANPAGALRMLRSQPLLAKLSATVFLQRLAHDSLPSVFVLYTSYRYHWDAATVGLALAAVGVAQMIVSAGLVGVVVRRFGERTALLTGLACGALGFAFYGLAPTGALFFAGLPLLALWGLAGPSLQGLMSQQVGATDQGKLQGAIASLQGVAGMMGPLVFTFVFAFALRAEGPLHVPGAPYLLAALLVALAFCTVARITRRATPGAHAEQPNA